MGSSFNAQILVEKLANLNNSQASIETLSHWCIFHMNKAKQVVETWDRQFHCSPREQRLAFLYLANDILQNSRRKGSEFVGEFWKVLPNALRVVIENGDEFARNAALRLIRIWEERKVFGSQGQILKEELVGRQSENSSRNGRHVGLKLKQPIKNMMDKIVSGYQLIYGGQMDEDVIFSKCRNAISCIEKVDKEIDTDVNTGKFNGSALVEEVQGQHAVLRDCVEQLTTVASSRASLVSYLREALQEQVT
ncbi:putative Exocyst subunit exo70 family protein C2 [Hibiscus syriacus]|uniref:Exocyst subunit exo70 family protein C2 n=1 Tax=Hibiscus syriacus TaxID=106335 RepID=A0A6A3C6D3_HIBSY|nr:putative Exocyst subunit exo70 family protein C2 [Hibiscus syriacus]